MAYTLPADHLVVVRVDYVDSQGHPASVDGAVGWSATPTNIVNVTVDPEDSQICTITPASQLGTAQVVATADADLGDGVRNIITTMDVTVVAGEAVSGTISPTGSPQPIAPHAEPRP